MLRLVLLSALVAAACAATAELWDMNDGHMQEVLDKHNEFRAQVDPDASNMEKMVWDNDAAATAASMAAACNYAHDARSARTPASWSHFWGGCGQNLYAAAGRVPSMTDAVQKWYDEVADYTYGVDTNVGYKVGHYTQVVWATSSHLGCAAVTCNGNSPFGSSWNPWYMIVCNYCPSGNLGWNGSNPYANPYKTGGQGSDCDDGGSADSDGLCGNSMSPQ